MVLPKDKILTNKVLLVFLLSLVIGINVLSAHRKTLTYDENPHYDYGERVLNGQVERVKSKDDSKMPVSALNALPKKFAQIFKSRIKSDKVYSFLIEVKTGRYITILFAVILAFYIYKWSSELYGMTAGIFSLSLFAFSPNIIAHARLITTDLYVLCFSTISMYYFWKFIKYGGLKWAVMSALSLGIVQLTKYSAVYLFLIYIILLLIKYIPELICFGVKKNYKPIRLYLLSLMKYFILFLFIVILIINMGFLFSKSMIPLKDFKFRSDLFQAAQSNLSSLGSVPVPLPYAYIDGLDWVKYNERTGASFGNIYLLEELRNLKNGDRAFVGYYIIAFLYKEPIAIQIIILMAFLLYLKNIKQFKFKEDELFLFCPIIFFTVYFNFMFKAQIGIRYLIIILPFLYVFCGSLFSVAHKINKLVKGGVILLLFWLIISVISYFPHYISYFNEFVCDRKKAYKILADSNIDWGQNEWYLNKFLKEHPDVPLRPSHPVTGKFVVGVNELVGIFNFQKYKWLRENFEPVDHIAYSYLIYDLSLEDLIKLRSKL